MSLTRHTVITSLILGWHIHGTPVPSGLVNCTKAGGHFNPLNATHGAPANDATKRHIGDLGNFQTDAQGNVKLDLSDKLVSLFGRNNVTGLAVVIHEKADDLGLGNNTASTQNGNAGARLACGNIMAGQVGGTYPDGYNAYGTTTASSAASTGTQSSSAEGLNTWLISLLTILCL